VFAVPSAGLITVVSLKPLRFAGAHHLALSRAGESSWLFAVVSHSAKATAAAPGQSAHAQTGAGSHCPDLATALSQAKVTGPTRQIASRETDGTNSAQR